jgi:hypothetical protein
MIRAKASVIAVSGNRGGGRRPKKGGDLVRITVRLKPEDYRAMRICAAENGWTGEETMREALRLLLTQKDKRR